MDYVLKLVDLQVASADLQDFFGFVAVIELVVVGQNVNVFLACPN